MVMTEGEMGELCLTTFASLAKSLEVIAAAYAKKIEAEVAATEQRMEVVEAVAMAVLGYAEALGVKTEEQGAGKSEAAAS